MNKDIFRFTKTQKIYHPYILPGGKKGIVHSDKEKGIQENKVISKKLYLAKKFGKYTLLLNG
jgi:hypothetical protein